MQAIYDKVEGREQRYELNLYITGEDEDERRSQRLAGDGDARHRAQAATPASTAAAERRRACREGATS